ncbi:MAG TPA: 3D domain-containing protein [Bryobacteraceae bacterium]|nr:3D domain-containing protein [Bryobacteraceae bacterium]
MTKSGAIRAICLLPALALAALARNPADGTYIATAYSVTGTTTAGTYTHRHVLAADPDILPIGSRVRIRRAGRYSGEYVVADTGEKIVGRKIDIYIPSTAECKRFGKKRVRLTVLEVGNGTKASAQQADQTVKKDVAHDVQQGTVGRAATEADWAAKKKSGTNPTQPTDTTPH